MFIVLKSSPYFLKIKKVVYNNEKDFLEANEEVEDFIILKFSEISKMYLQNFKAFINRLEYTVIRDVEDSLRIQLETRLNDKDLDVVAKTMVEHL